jgi:hypothetical protein
VSQLLLPSTVVSICNLRCSLLLFDTTQSRIALPCPQGTFKPHLSNTAGCTRCPIGSTTRSIRSTSLSDCSIALPGYQVDWQSPSTPQPVACPVGTYSNGYTTEPCRTCPLGLQTPSTGSSSAAACSAPPGAGFYCAAGPHPVGVGPVSTKMLQDSGSPCVLQCPSGSFKEGWGLGPCLTCGVNFRCGTDTDTRTGLAICRHVVSALWRRRAWGHASSVPAFI